MTNTNEPASTAQAGQPRPSLGKALAAHLKAAAEAKTSGKRLPR